MNWVAPSTIKVNTMKMQTNVASCVVNQSNRNITLALMPEFTYKKGQLWLLEGSTIKQLATANINVDRSFTLNFKEKSDSRDSRPLNYRGRVLLGATGSSGKDSIFASSMLYQEGRTEMATQVHTKDMIAVEDTSETALPSTTDDSAEAWAQGAKKFEQIGSDAYLKLIEAVLGKVSLPGRGAVFLLDLTLGTGGLFKAFVQKKGAYNFPLYYFGLTDEAVTEEWFGKTMHQELAKDFLEGNLSIPGFVKPNPEVSADLLETQPAPPRLNLLTPSDDLYPIVPDKVTEALTHN